MRSMVAGEGALRSASVPSIPDWGMYALEYHEPVLYRAVRSGLAGVTVSRQRAVSYRFC